MARASRARSDRKSGMRSRRRDWSARRRRNRICIAVIAVGLLNFLVYTISYAVLGGDAHNGWCHVEDTAHGPRAVYVIRGHHLQSITGRQHEVSRAVWIYSYLHSISVPLTSAAMVISMLVLARPHIIATMRGGVISGRVFLWGFGTIVALVTGLVVVLFSISLVEQLRRVAAAAGP